MPTKPKAPRISTPSPPSTAMQIAVTGLQISDAIQPRAHLNHAVVEEYATVYREQEDGEPEHLPALDVFQIDGAYFVADGFHRHAAAMQAQRATLPCEVFQGTVQDALRHAALANLMSTLPYTHSDKQRVLERLLTDPEVGQRSDRSIAKMMGLSHVTVGRARQRLAHVATLTKELRSQPTTAAIPATKRQQQVAALLALPTEETLVLAKHDALKPDAIVHEIAQRMADRKESTEDATKAVARNFSSAAARYTHNDAAGFPHPVRRREETKEDRARRQAENLRKERYYTLSNRLGGFADYLPFTPTSEEVVAGVEPHTPSPTIEEMVASVGEWDRDDILERLQYAYRFLDAVKAACQEQGWAL